MRFSLVSLGCFMAILCFVLATGSYWLWPWTTTVRTHLPASEVPLILPEGAQDVSYAIHPSGEFRLEFTVNEPELIDWIKSGIGPMLEEDNTPYIDELQRPTRIGRFWGLTSFSRGDTWITIQDGFAYSYVSEYDAGIIVVYFDRDSRRAYCRLEPPQFAEPY